MAQTRERMERELIVCGTGTGPVTPYMGGDTFVEADVEAIKGLPYVDGACVQINAAIMGKDFSGMGLPTGGLSVTGVDLAADRDMDGATAHIIKGHCYEEGKNEIIIGETLYGEINQAMGEDVLGKTFKGKKRNIPLLAYSAWEMCFSI
jgi:hypothetical protein